MYFQTIENDAKTLPCAHSLSHTMETRSNNYLLRLPQVKLETAKQGFYYDGAKLYNSLSLKLRMEPHLNKFKTLLTDF